MNHLQKAGPTRLNCIVLLGETYWACMSSIQRSHETIPMDWAPLRFWETQRVHQNVAGRVLPRGIFSSPTNKHFLFIFCLRKAKGGTSSIMFNHQIILSHGITLLHQILPAQWQWQPPSIYDYNYSDDPRHAHPITLFASCTLPVIKRSAKSAKPFNSEEAFRKVSGTSATRIPRALSFSRRISQRNSRLYQFRNCWLEGLPISRG